MKTLILSFIVLFVFSAISFAQDGRSYTKDPIKLTEYATDETSTLRPKEYIKLKNRLQRFYDSTSTQIVFLMINSLNGESIEEVANAIFRFNQIGMKDKNNGVLFMIAKDDRKIRIEVGYGLEGVLTDAACKMIIKNQITPDLKNDNYNEGINKGIDAIEAVVRGEFTTEKFPDTKENESFWDSTAFSIILIAFFILIPLAVVVILGIKGKFRSGGGSGYSGSSYSSSNSSSFSSYDSSSSSSSDSGFSGGGGDSGGGGASGDY
ncbi:MAG: TPM domain-containing protein [Ignavibacteria bacterium]|nr:TPM domain-containing protein [Ignavibacteria bacterium]